MGSGLAGNTTGLRGGDCGETGPGVNAGGVGKGEGVTTGTTTGAVVAFALKRLIV
jgi:hypothetical protein